MRLLEDYIEDKVCKYAVDKGALSLKLNLMGNTGWPDRLFLYEGHQVYIEFKRPGQGLKRNQPDRVYRLVMHGATVGVFDDAKTSCYFLDATIFSDDWRRDALKTGMCWFALQAWIGKDLSDVYGISYLARQGLCAEMPSDLSPPACLRRVAAPEG